MSILVSSVQDYGNRNRITNLAPAVAAGQAVTFEQLNSAIEGLGWKDDVRVASTVNVTVATPGTAIDGITLTSGDRVLLKNQTTQTENGIYIFNGSAVPLTRSLDANTFDELEAAVVTVQEGTANIGSTWRQTQVNGVIGTNNVLFVPFGTAAAAASETVAGIIEIATQAETNTGTDDVRAITPLKLANYTGFVRKYVTTVGDGTTTSLAVTHNLGTLDCQVYAYEVGGLKREVFVEKQHTSTTVVTLVFDVAPAASSIRVVVQA